MQFGCRDCGNTLRGLWCETCKKQWPDPVIPFLEAWAKALKEKGLAGK